MKKLFCKIFGHKWIPLKSSDSVFACHRCFTYHLEATWTYDPTNGNWQWRTNR